MHKQSCGCLSKAQESRTIGMYAITIAVDRSIEIVKVRLQGNAREGLKERLVGKAMAKRVH